MKSTLRKIVINQTEYVYHVSDKFDPETFVNTLTIKVYLSGKKRTPLTIHFLTMEQYYAGQPLKTGVDLFNNATNSTVSVNLTEPKFIRQLIDLAIEKGWNAENQLQIDNGMSWLSELGYDVREMIAEVEEILVQSAKLKKLGYTRSWLHCGLLSQEMLSEQEQLFDKGEDQNTEHYRFAACVHYLKSKKELSDLELERYFMILKKDPDTYMAGSALMEVFKRIKLNDEQFDRFSVKFLSLGDWTIKTVLRETLLRKLQNEAHTEVLISECILKGDQVVQKYLLDSCSLNPDQLQELSIHGKNKEIRSRAKRELD